MYPKGFKGHDTNSSVLKKLFIVFLFVLFNGKTAHCQLLINEICPANISVIQNSTGDFFDYIELINTGNNSINLAGYAINDEPMVESGSILPDYTLPPGSRLLIFASGSDEVETIDHKQVENLFKYHSLYAPGEEPKKDDEESPLPPMPKDEGPSPSLYSEYYDRALQNASALRGRFLLLFVKV